MNLLLIVKENNLYKKEINMNKKFIYGLLISLFLASICAYFTYTATYNPSLFLIYLFIIFGSVIGLFLLFMATFFISGDLEFFSFNDNLRGWIFFFSPIWLSPLSYFLIIHNWDYNNVNSEFICYLGVGMEISLLLYFIINFSITIISNFLPYQIKRSFKKIL